MCSIKNGLWLLKYAGRPTKHKCDKNGVEKLSQTQLTEELKGIAEREREREVTFKHCIYIC